MAQHTHDFAEMMYVRDGAGEHLVDGTVSTLTAGDLVLVRPWDVHAIRVSEGAALELANVAFPLESLRDFATVAGMDDIVGTWLSAAGPVTTRLSPPSGRVAQLAFERASAAPPDAATMLNLCRFWSEVLELFNVGAAPIHRVPPPGTPAWLTDAVARLSEDAVLRHGARKFAELAVVSPAHLSRSVRAAYRMTPTELVNTIKLEHAGRLILSTTKPIATVAFESGFENLSYFYRLFRKQFGSTPLGYREKSRRWVPAHRQYTTEAQDLNPADA